MDLGSLFLGIALLLGVVFLVARPLIDKQTLKEKDISAADHLVAQREALLAALRDLDFDHTTGKITAEDYAPQRAQLVAEGVVVLKELEALGGSAQNPTADDPVERAIRARRKAASAGDLDDLVEAAVASRRSAPAASAEGVSCPRCGAATRAADKFCPRCGVTLSTTCPECGRVALPADRFCAGCGAKLSLSEAVA